MYYAPDLPYDMRFAAAPTTMNLPPVPSREAKSSRASTTENPSKSAQNGLKSLV